MGVSLTLSVTRATRPSERRSATPDGQLPSDLLAAALVSYCPLRWPNDLDLTALLPPRRPPAHFA